MCVYVFICFCGVLVPHGSIMTVQYDVAIFFYLLFTFLLVLVKAEQSVRNRYSNKLSMHGPDD